MDTLPSNLSHSAKKNLQRWLGADFSSTTHEAIQAMINKSPDDLENAFYTQLSFGTGGLRGLMGVGPNRLNVETVSFVTQALANTLIKRGSPDPKVFIGYDSRHHSKEFAETAAAVLAANGIHAYLTKEICPTPVVSFGCRHYKCQAAIMITASHNPAAYNGYKVYGQDGGQVLPPHDTHIMEEASKISSPKAVKITSLQSPLIHWVAEEIQEAYIEAMIAEMPKRSLIQEKGSQLHLVYTSLHGTGTGYVPPLLQRLGFTHLSLVKSQSIPDGDFPTVSSPNPEEPKALALGVDLLNQEKADLLLSTDPDADRMRAVIRHEGKAVFLNGNQIACLLLYHVCTASKLPFNAGFIKTIVTTELFRKIAESFKGECLDVLTGFKYIAEKIQLWETTAGSPTYVFGGEESYGTLYGTKTRDKDGVLASALFAEMALQLKTEGKTVIDLLNEIYQRYGLYAEKLLSLSFPETKEGRQKMGDTMARLRKSPPHKLGSFAVKSITDYFTSISLNLNTYAEEKVHLPVSDVLQFVLEDESKLVVRPSGTEPKIKIYCEVRRPLTGGQEAAETDCTNLLGALNALLT